MRVASCAAMQTKIGLVLMMSVLVGSSGCAADQAMDVGMATSGVGAGLFESGEDILYGSPGSCWRVQTAALEDVIVCEEAVEPDPEAGFLTMGVGLTAMGVGAAIVGAAKAPPKPPPLPRLRRTAQTGD
jgi:hypothetical protein